LIFSKSYVPTAFLLLLRRGKSRPSRQRKQSKVLQRFSVRVYFL